MLTFDLIIIGAGPGGYETAVEAAGKGLSVAIFEECKPGGTCLNEGCIPTKVLCRNAEVASTLRHAATFGISAGTALTIDMPAIQERKQQVTDQLAAGVEGLLAKPGITLVKAHATFTSAHTVVADGQEYSAPNVIIATGSVSKPLPVPGMDLPGVLTSREMLAIDHIPQRLCVIGAGVIGIEFASIFSRLGSEVTMVEFAKEILPPLDSDVAKRLRQSLTKSGIAINLGAAVTAITQASDPSSQALVVHFEQKGKPCEVEADTVLVAVGRAPRTDGFDLEHTGVEYTGRGITVDGNMMTTVPGLYAIGDVNARCMLAHAATFQGRHALHHILNEVSHIRLDIVPAAVFCQPEAAMVGFTEDQCKAQALEVKVGKTFFRANGKALAMGEPDGYVKLISEKVTGRILGCHLFGPHAADLVQEVATLMTLDGTIRQLADSIHSHPTLGEAIMLNAQSIM